MTTQEFQSTHPFGCDFTPILRGLFFLRFNPRTRLGATIQVVPLPANGSSFNPRTRLGATLFSLVPVLVLRVSIHAPVWVRPTIRFRPTRKTGFQSTHPFGCDGLIFSVPVLLHVSIHAPVWVRPCRIVSKPPLRRFQSTHPFGCDIKTGLRLTPWTVSIHAPVWVRPRRR